MRRNNGQNTGRFSCNVRDTIVIISLVEAPPPLSVAAEELNLSGTLFKRLFSFLLNDI